MLEYLDEIFIYEMIENGELRHHDGHARRNKRAHPSDDEEEERETKRQRTGNHLVLSQ